MLPTHCSNLSPRHRHPPGPDPDLEGGPGGPGGKGGDGSGGGGGHGGWRRLALSREGLPVALVLLFNSVAPQLREGAKEGGEFRFNANGIPWLEEVGKLAFTSVCLLQGLAGAPKYGLGGAWGALIAPLLRGDWSGPGKSLAFAVPSVCYALQGYLYWEALKYMDPAAYVILNNVKLLITGLLEHAVLHIRLSHRQMVSLLVLTCGICVSQYKGGPVASMFVLPWQGYALSVGNSLAAALGNVSVKYLYSHTPGSFHEQNWKLYVYGTVFRTAILWRTTHGAMSDAFVGYTPYIYGVVAVCCGAHLVTALVVKVHSAVAKGYTVSIAMLLTILLSWAIFGKRPPPLYLAALPMICWAVFAYVVPAAKPAAERDG